jgi:hypothetical protein
MSGAIVDALKSAVHQIPESTNLYATALDTTKKQETQPYVPSSRTKVLPIIYNPRRLIYNTHPHNNTLTSAERNRLPKTRPCLLPEPAGPAEVARMEDSKLDAAVPGSQLAVARAES